MIPHGSHRMGGVLLLLAALSVLTVASFHKDSSTRVQHVSETHTHITLRRRTASVSTGLPTRAQRTSSRVHIQQWHAAAASNSTGLELPLHVFAVTAGAGSSSDGEQNTTKQIAGGSMSMQGLVNRQVENNTVEAATTDDKVDSSSTIDLPDLARKFGGWKDQYVALCLAFKDQHADLKEWIEHHLALGCEQPYSSSTRLLKLPNVCTCCICTSMFAFSSLLDPLTCRYHPSLISSAHRTR